MKDILNKQTCTLSVPIHLKLSISLERTKAFIWDSKLKTNARNVSGDLIFILLEQCILECVKVSKYNNYAPAGKIP